MGVVVVGVGVRVFLGVIDDVFMVWMGGFLLYYVSVWFMICEHCSF